MICSSQVAVLLSIQRGASGGKYVVYRHRPVKIALGASAGFTGLCTISCNIKPIDRISVYITPDLLTSLLFPSHVGSVFQSSASLSLQKHAIRSSQRRSKPRWLQISLISRPSRSHGINPYPARTSRRVYPPFLAIPLHSPTSIQPPVPFHLVAPLLPFPQNPPSKAILSVPPHRCTFTASPYPSTSPHASRPPSPSAPLIRPSPSVVGCRRRRSCSRARSGLGQRGYGGRSCSTGHTVDRQNKGGSTDRL